MNTQIITKDQQQLNLTVECTHSMTCIHVDMMPNVFGTYDYTMHAYIATYTV